MSSWQMVLLEPAKIMLAQIGQFVVNVLLVMVILLIGWLIAKVIRSIVEKLLKSIKIDELSSRIELEGVLTKGGIKYSISELIAVVIYWLTILVTLVVAINAIGLTIAAELLNRVVFYIPNVIAAIFILIAGMFVATLLKNIVQTIVVNSGLSEDKFFSRIVEVLVMIFAVIIALEQLNIGVHTLQLTLSIILGAFGLGLALAFGLGCKDIAGKAVSELVERLKKK